MARSNIPVDVNYSDCGGISRLWWDIRGVVEYSD